MKKYAVWLLLFGLFLLEGTLLEWLIPAYWQTQIYVVPHFSLVVILYISVFVNRYYGLGTGLAYGFLQDIIYYGHALGVYSFAMGIAGYAVGLIVRRGPQQLFPSLQLMILGLILYDLMVYGIYRYFLRVASVEFQWMLMHQLLPSLFVNLLFALAVYVPLRNLLEHMSAFVQNEDS